MIDLGSIAGLHAHSHRLHAYCPRCYRWANLPLAKMIANGQRARRLPLPVRCNWGVLAVQFWVRPPIPTRRDSVGWISMGLMPTRDAPTE